MLGSPIIEVFIGLVFVYLLLSVVCSAVQEMISQAFGMRAKNLRHGIERLLPDEATRQAFLNHPLIKALGERPSYIRPHTFALAMLDVVAPAGKILDTQPDPTDPSGKKPVYAEVLDFAGVREAISELGEGDLRTTLLTLVDASDRNLDEARAKLETWFDCTMERASGWYKRKTQWIVLSLGLIAVAVTNADTIAMAKGLWENADLRQGLVAAADDYIVSATASAAAGSESAVASQALADLNQQLKDLELPLGWSTLPTGWGPWLSKIVGMLLSALAVSLGAPFWFDIINRFVRLRGTGTLAPSAGDGRKSG